MTNFIKEREREREVERERDSQGDSNFLYANGKLQVQFAQKQLAFKAIDLTD